MPFVEVAVDFPDDRARTFTYKTSGGSSVGAGDLVWVPFGAQILQGVVFSTAGTSQVSEPRAVISKVAGGPYLSPERLDLAKWVARYYRSTLFAACSLMLPPGSRTRLRTYVRLPHGASRPDGLRPGEQRVWRLLEGEGWVRKDRIARRLGRSGKTIVDRLARRGDVESRSEWERPRVRAVFKNVVRLRASKQEASELSAQFEGARHGRRAELLRRLSAGNAGETRAALGRQFGLAAVKWALESGVAELESERVERDPLAGFTVQQQFPLDPTPAQQDAISVIVRATGHEAKAPGRFLLYGVTGSGKTEVYLQAAEHVVKTGRRVLVLVPEIALTPQTLRRFASRFPGKVALLHSGLSGGERFDQWWRIKNGDFPVVLGSRSAVFAPVDNLGLIVIDEEHEWTYKEQDRAPRYHSRDAAERLAATCRATLVLGSATPSLTSFRRAERGDLHLLRLPGRPVQITGLAAGSEGRAAVELVDLREELKAGHTDVLSRRLLDVMKVALSAGERVILFLNRRGLAAFVQCASCGLMRRCRRCDISLAHHAASGGRGPRLVCHFCNYSVRASRACPACGGKSVKRTGAGTEAVADLVRQHFPRAGVIRWDSDTARTFKDHAKILDQFENGTARVLVGTQMVAKGLDIPSVTVVGAVTADIGLGAPDYTAAERVFQVLAQVAGRAGRSPLGGRVIIQTMQPGHFALKAAASQDYDLFYQQEVEVRARFNLPPFTRLIRLTVKGPDAGLVHKDVYAVASRLEEARVKTGLTDTEVVGPTPAYPLRMRDMYRWQIVLTGPRPDALLDAVPLPQGWTVDVDPAPFA